MAVIGNGIINSGGQGITKNNFPIVKYTRGASSISGTYTSLQCLNNDFIRAYNPKTGGYITRGSYYFTLDQQLGVQQNILFNSEQVSPAQTKKCLDSSRVIYNYYNNSGYYIQILKNFYDNTSTQYRNKNVLAIAKSTTDNNKKYFWIGPKLGNLDAIDIGDIYSLDNDRVIIEASSKSPPPDEGWNQYMDAGYYIASRDLVNLYNKNNNTATEETLLKIIKIPLIDSLFESGIWAKISSFYFLGKYESNYWFLFDVLSSSSPSAETHKFLYVTSDFDTPDSNNSRFIEIVNKDGYARYFVTDNYLYILRHNTNKIFIDYIDPSSTEFVISEKEIDKNESGTSGAFKIQSVNNSILIEYTQDSNTTIIYSDGNKNENKFYKLSTDVQLNYCQLLNNNKLIYAENDDQNFGATRVAISDITTDSSTSTFTLSDPKYSLNWIQPAPAICNEVIRYDRPYLNDVLYYRKLKNTYLIKSLLNLSICNKDFQIFCNCSDDRKVGGPPSSAVLNPCDFYLAESNNYILMLVETNNTYPYYFYLYIEK